MVTMLCLENDHLLIKGSVDNKLKINEKENILLLRDQVFINIEEIDEMFNFPGNMTSYLSCGFGCKLC